MRLRQIKHFLTAGAETGAPFTTLAQRDDRLDELKTGAARRVPRIEKCRQTLHSVGFCNSVKRENAERSRAGCTQMSGPRTGCEEHREQDRRDHDSGAEI